MTLSVGTKLGPYEILALLGRGGMGEVYRARDTKLGRDVALKVLPEAFAADAERMARFQREAQVLASLNHPHIAAIYGLEDSSSARALVMELVEGPTLAERLSVAPPSRRQGPEVGKMPALQFDEALAIAKQIAEALEAAHERGIIHRDLKPANIKITPEGAVKVLDFGLAKALNPQDSTTNLNQANSPTLSAAATQAGLILGTAAYMSPEQAKGKSVDRRADIWAFGCVLYEMLTGRQAFEGETISDVLAAVIRAEPDWATVPPNTPASIRKLTQRCLQKDPKQRLQAIGEARIAIEEALTGGTGVSPVSIDGQDAHATTGEHRSPLQRALPWALAALCFVIAGVFAIGYFRTTSIPVPSVRSYILPPEKTTFAFEAATGTPALSPDGRWLVFAARDSSGKEMLWVRPLDSLSAQPLQGTQGASFPFWSPDNRFVGYFASGKLMKIEISGGPAQTVCDAPSGRGGTWSAKGVIVFAPVQTGGLDRVPAAGGSSAPLVPLDKSSQLFSLRWPVFLPDGRHFMYWAGNPFSAASPSATRGIYLGSLDGQGRKFLFPADSDALYAPPGYLLFLSGGVNGETLMARPFDTRGLTPAGEALPVAEHVANPRNFSLGHFSVSQQGDLVYETSEPDEAQVAWMDRSGKQLGAVGKPGIITDPRLSPDGKTLAEVVTDPQSRNYDLWLVDLARGVRTRFTFNPAVERHPAWSPDGTRITFSSIRGGQFDIYVKPANGTGTSQPLVQDNAIKYVDDWSSDGRYIAYNRFDPQGKTGWDLWILPLFGDKKPFPFLASQFNEGDASFSPDGKWLAYSSDESGNGRLEVYVVAFPQGNGKWQVSTSGGLGPRWRRDGKELFYISEDNKLMAVAIQEKSGTLEIGSAQALFQGTGTHYDVTADGKKFVVLTQSTQSGAEPITLVVNWPALLKKQ
ncbi:MAG TPA: protein kinase [Terriglobia bacterium]|nr:protein kinase [Terriglobia bacterium]